MDDLSAEEKIERLRQMVNTHAATLTKLESRLDTEQDERRKADAEAERRLLSLDQDLRGVIAEAASGGIRLQTAGVVLFAFGLIVGLIGNLLA